MVSAASSSCMIYDDGPGPSPLSDCCSCRSQLSHQQGTVRTLAPPVTDYERKAADDDMISEIEKVHQVLLSDDALN